MSENDFDVQHQRAQDGRDDLVLTGEEIELPGEDSDASAIIGESSAPIHTGEIESVAIGGLTGRVPALGSHRKHRPRRDRKRRRRPRRLGWTPPRAPIRRTAWERESPARPRASLGRAHLPAFARARPPSPCRRRKRRWCR